jgi:signal transduction histidine kinase
LTSYFLLAYGFSMWFGESFTFTNPLLVGLSILLIATLLNPVRAWLQGVIDTVFFRGERAHQERLKIFTRELTNATDLNSVLRILREQITASLLPSRLHIYIYDPLNDQYIATVDETRQLTSDIRFAANSPLPTVLRKESVPLFVDQERPPESIMAERGRLALLGAQLFVPLPGRERLIGWSALGERLSGENYASHDIGFLQTLTSQSAVAFERAQVMTNMERRVNEMNALARVAQGINITLNFDDILELIYAQTLQIMPGNDFHLMLYNKTAQYFYYAFCLENDERIHQKENLPLASKTTLDQEIILSRRSIMSQDFVGQCQVMGVSPNVRGLYAWLGVPLNTGMETIGALSISSRDPGVTYTPIHVDLLQAIADQAAGAIVKSGLLQETERRAQQLSILNVITRQLTSTLDLEPLLENILENAVNILNSEAGSLFLVDEQNDELIFKVTVGPVASNLVGQRLPAGTGFVGKAVTSRQAVIVNDVQASASFNPVTDKQTGFITKTILAVPMEVKDHVIGVIEIINKKDGLPFTEDDQNLLTAFAGQAAVAIENARLYTLTDQELGARVEELSVMQRIDRELNASLEVDRAMRITLEWAMRQSQAEAGVIGLVQEKGVRLVADQGYGKLLEKYHEEYLPLDHPAVSEAINTGQPQRILLNQSDPERAFLTGARSQLVVPIRREAKTIGLFLLESATPERFQQDAFNFISRLSDHSAIAISNAQLYAEVQAANVAKSKFVDFVAHELKQPMTSMKGFSDLLAAGAAGPINETQANFLNTIRSNMGRMQTIVQDLNDNSKIESGTLEIKFQVVDLAEVLDEVNRSIKRQLEDKKQMVNLDVPQNLPKVWADRGRVIQVLVNLISNAHKYTPEGGNIDISAEVAQNTWDLQGASTVVHIRVKDNGIGISPENQKKIFTPFHRARDDEEAMKSPGTGLGLNITKNLVEMQGGRIWFESEFRKGTIFHITIPVSENIPVAEK